MALVVKDRVKETTTTTGTGTLTLLGSTAGYQSFSVIGNANTTYYAIVDSTAGTWEVGIGTYTAAGTTLSRDTILESSTGGTAVSFAAGTKEVFCTYPAERSVYVDGTTITPATAATLPIVSGGTGATTAPDALINLGALAGAASSTDNAVARFDGATGKIIQNSTVTIDDAANISGAASVSLLTNTTPAIFTKNDNVSSWIYSNKSFSVTAQETTPTGLFFSPDGTRMYIIGTTGDDVTQYALATAWDVTTSTLVQTSATVGDTSPAGLYFRADGLKMYVVGTTNDSVREFDLSVAWDVSTITFLQEFFVSAQDLTPNDLWFKPNGLKMYVVGSTSDRVYEYDLSSAWNISTATFLQFFSVTAQETNPVGINFNASGTNMYVLGTSGIDINQYILSTAWDVTTAVFAANFYVGLQESVPNGLFVDTNSNVAYVVGTASDTVFQYTTTTDGIELVSNAGLSVDGNLVVTNSLVVPTARIDGPFSVAGGTSLSTTGISGTLTATGTINASGAVNMSTITGVITLGTVQTTGTFAVGGTLQTGAITVGQSTAAQTLNLATGATATATTKTVNLGTAGLSGSTTSINIGSAVAGATSTTTLNGTTNQLGSLQLSNFTETVFAVTGTTPALTPTNGTIQTWTLTANSTPTAGTWAAGQSVTLMIDDGTAFTVTWSSLAVTWKTDAGLAPTLNLTGFTAITLWKVGTTIYGARVGNA